MSTKNHHVILRSRIEVTIEQHSPNSTLQHTIHQTIQQRVIPILSKLFSKYVPNDVIIHLDKLVIDGGSFTLATLEKQLPGQIEQKLMLQLKEQIGKVIDKPDFQQVIPLPYAKQQAVAHYLSEGNFAWWMTERSEKQIETIYLELLHHKPLLIEQLWYNLHKKEKAVQRCVTLFSRATLAHTLACLLKQPIEYFKPILTEIGVLLHQTKILTNLLYTPEEQLLSMTLLGILNQPNAKVDRMGLLRMLLKQVAIQTSTSYEKILEKLHTYYTQNEKKSACDPTTKALVFQLRDLAVTPPKFWYKYVENQEKILKELDKIGNNTLAQPSETMRSIKLAMHQSNLRLLVKSWLQEEKNRAKLANHLPDTLFVTFLESIDPALVALFSGFTQLATATTATAAPVCAIKSITLAYYAFGHVKTFYFEEIKSLFRKCMANSLINQQRLATLLTTQAYNPTIKAIMRPLVSISNPPLSLDRPQTIIHSAGVTHLQRAIAKQTDLLHRAHSITPKLLLGSSLAASSRHAIGLLPNAGVGDRLASKAIQVGYPHLPACFSSLSKGLTKAYPYRANDATGAAPLDTSQDSQLGNDPKNPLSDVVDFLAYNELPPDQLVPAYCIAKCLECASPQQIRAQLAPLCQEATILKKLIQHTTAQALSKLLHAFIPFPKQMVDGLEKVMMQVIPSSQQQTNIRLIHEILITAALIHTPSEQQYIARILLHLSAHTTCRPITLCDQLIDAAKQEGDAYLAETFSLLKEKLAPLNLSKIDDIDLIFLSTDAALDQTPLYYSSLLPAIKQAIRQSDDLSQSTIDQLVAQHLPTQPLQATISLALYKQITDAVQSKKERVAQRWYLFLHTGKLGNYPDSTALLNDVVAHLPTFPLAQHKIDVRQRLIVHFTHRQLMLLVQKHSTVGQSLANLIQGSYQLWCATQGSLTHPHSTKNIFWDSVLKMLPQQPIAQDDWLAQITTEWSNLLEIPPTTLLGTFQLLETKDIPERLTTSLNRLQEKYRQTIQQQAIQRGYKAPILTKLYLLLNGDLSLFTQQYHLSLPALGNALIHSMADQPAVLTKFLEAQDNHQLVARRMVHYFSPTVTTKLIATLAKDNDRFVMHYLALLSHPLQPITTPRYHPSTWKKELYISTIDYLITKRPFNATAFVYSTMLAICYPKEAVYQIITSIVEAAGQQEDKVITLLKSLIKRMNQPTMHQPALAHHPVASVTNHKASSASLPAEEVRVYTQNSGLVFLWPFFYDFFKAHHLMVGNQFFCEQASHNAVYLLQYLVTGKLNHPEWQLTLPKLLCGLSYDEVLRPYSAIDADYDLDDQAAIDTIEANPAPQLQQPSTAKIQAGRSIASNAMEAIAINSQLLIEKVTKRWKSLAKLQETAQYATMQELLKQYCLNRLGILTRQEANDATKSKFWHLMIVHQDHDSVDLLPPWSMTRVKLPWMQEAIVLFWMPT